MCAQIQVILPANWKDARQKHSERRKRPSSGSGKDWNTRGRKANWDSWLVLCASEERSAMKRRLSETPSCSESSQLNSPRCLDLALHWPVCCPDDGLSLEVHSRRPGDAVLVNMRQVIGCMCGFNLSCASALNCFFFFLFRLATDRQHSVSYYSNRISTVALYPIFPCL